MSKSTTPQNGTPFKTLSLQVLFLFLVTMQLPLARASDCTWLQFEGPGCLTNGIISFNGMFVTGEYVPFNRSFKTLAEIEENWSKPLTNGTTYASQVREAFRDMREKYHASSVRLIIHPKRSEYNEFGIDFPTPSSQNITDLKGMIDAAASVGLKVYLVMILPSGWRSESPTGRIDSVYKFWDNLFPAVLAWGTGPDGRPRHEHISFIDIFGDFDPMNVYGQLGTQVAPAVNEPVPANTKLGYHREWFRRMWPNFYSWHTYIPAEKKTFEVVGGYGSPVTLVKNAITWSKQEIRKLGYQEPARYAFAAYASPSWADGYAGGWFVAYSDLWNSAAEAAGGPDRIIVEELGVDSCLHPENINDDIGTKTFSAALSALYFTSPSTPVAIWTYAESSNPCDPNNPLVEHHGLIRGDGTPKYSWWTIPFFFSK